MGNFIYNMKLNKQLKGGAKVGFDDDVVDMPLHPFSEALHSFKNTPINIKVSPVRTPQRSHSFS